jgi:hypothetical protein
MSGLLSSIRSARGAASVIVPAAMSGRRLPRGVNAACPAVFEGVRVRAGAIGAAAKAWR